MGEEKTFVFGVGAQKCGTSWLQDYLASHPSSNMGFTKEYHILDALYVPQCAGFMGRILARLEGPKKNHLKGDAESASFYENINNYYDYFAGLLSQSPGKNHPAVNLTGDVTPSYSLLPPDIMASVKSRFAERDIRVRTIFLMRDPVERIWSQVRMTRREAARGSIARRAMLDRSEVEQLQRGYRSVQNFSRTRYDLTLSSIDAAFDPDEVLVGFYEEMFNPAFIRQVTDFLGIDYVTPNFGKQVNQSAKTSDLPQDVRSKIANHYAETYHYVADRFGADRIASIWSGYGLLT